MAKLGSNLEPIMGYIPMASLAISVANGCAVTINNVQYTETIQTFVNRINPTCERLFFDLQCETSDGPARLFGAILDCPAGDLSFSQAMQTRRGGTHVKAISTAILNGMRTRLGDSNDTGRYKLSSAAIKSQCMIVVFASVANQKPDSQAKDHLAAPSFKLPAFDISAMTKWKCYKRWKRIVETKDKDNEIDGSEKHLPANGWPRRRKGQKRRLIFCEGDSAKAYVMSAIKHMGGRDGNGVLPIRGNLPNAEKCSLKELSQNAEVEEIRRANRLEPIVSEDKTDYSEPENRNALPYDEFVIATDADAPATTGELGRRRSTPCRNSPRKSAA